MTHNLQINVEESDLEYIQNEREHIEKLGV